MSDPKKNPKVEFILADMVFGISLGEGKFTSVTQRDKIDTFHLS